MDGSLDSIEKRGNETLELVTGEFGGSIDVIHEGLDVQGRLGIGRQDLLEFLATDRKTESGLGARQDIDLVFGLELLGKVLKQGVVNVPATEIGLVCSTLDVQPTFGEGYDGDREA